MRTMALLCVLALVCLVPQLSAALEEGSTTKDVRVAVVIFGCSRPSHLRKTFRSLSKQDPSVLRHVQFFVSIDAHRRSRHVHHAAEDEAENLDIPLTGVWRHPEPSDESLDTRARISRHYYLGLARVFAEPLRPTHAIVLEDDLDLSPDFLSFLLAFATSTSTDPGVGPAAISGWNDNGAARGVADAKGTMLTGFFPGLGWLLSREVWDEIAPLWPCHCRREGIKGGVGGRRRKFPAAAAAPAGWDWWLRGEFHARGWYTLYPSLGRVAHRGGQGTNVAPAQQKAVFKDARVADGSNALGPDEWAAERVSARVTEGAYRAWLDAHDREARSVSISDIHGGYLTGGLRGRIGMHPPTEEAIFRVTFADDGFRKIASRLALWPHPRGFFEGRLLLPLKGGASLLLVREDASVGRRRSALKSGFLADRNQSCADACGKRGGVCVPRAVAALNDCGALARAFGCRGGCVFETGVDIPAVVVADAPIETKSACVVTEDAGAIGCRGEFAHTRRACVCGRREGAGAYMAEGGRGPSRGRARPSGAGRGGPSRRPPRRARGGRLNGRKKDEL